MYRVGRDGAISSRGDAESGRGEVGVGDRDREIVDELKLDSSGHHVRPVSPI